MRSQYQPQFLYVEDLYLIGCGKRTFLLTADFRICPGFLYIMSDQETQVGNPDAAQDLYGLGVRIGFYLQALGMLLYMYSGEIGDNENNGGENNSNENNSNNNDRNSNSGEQNIGERHSGENYGQGLKVASGTITVSILAAWFRFAARGLFSPCEAVIVLLLLISLYFPAKLTLSNPRTIIGEMVGLIALLLVELGTCSALLWTFARLVITLPVLGTENVVFFFAKVALDGWFRVAALVYCVFDAATSIIFVYRVMGVTKIAWCYYNDPTRPNKESRETIDRIEEIMNRKPLKKETQYFSWILWLLIVVSVEVTIYWNNLSPSNDLQTPGQLMPLITGTIIVIDSSLVANRRRKRPFIQKRNFRNKVNTTLASIRDGVERAGRLKRFSRSGLRNNPQELLPTASRH